MLRCFEKKHTCKFVRVLVNFFVLFHLLFPVITRNARNFFKNYYVKDILNYRLLNGHQRSEDKLSIEITLWKLADAILVAMTLAEYQSTYVITGGKKRTTLVMRVYIDVLNPRPNDDPQRITRATRNSRTG